MSETDQIEETIQADAQPAQDGSSSVGIAVQSLTIADCGPLYEQIMTVLNGGQQVTLNLADCDDVDTAGLQLLTAIQCDPVVNLKVHWSNASEPVIQKATRLGLVSWVEAGSVEA